MEKSWKVKLFESKSRKSPVEEFIDLLDAKARLKITRTIELLEEFGLEGGYPNIKKLQGSNLWEYRILGKDNIRIFYITVKEKTFLLLHAFKKKKQKTPEKEIDLALERIKVLTIK